MVETRTKQSARRRWKNSSKLRLSTSDKVLMVFIYLLLTIAMLAVLYPLLFILAASFSDARMVSAGRVWLWPVNPSLLAYEAVFKNPRIVTSLLNSLFYMFAGTAINLLFTVLAAYPLSRPNLMGRNLISGIFVFTMLFSGGLIPTYLLVSNLGLLDTRWVMLLISALSVWNIIVTRTYYQTVIPEELHEAALLDGCDEFRFLLLVAIPLSGPILAVMALYYGVGHWNSYFNAMLYLRNENLYPLQIILRNILVLQNMDTSMIKDADVLLRMQGLADLLKYSVSVVSTVPLLMIYPFVQKYFIKGVMVGALKG
jgi:putative aldouronate transport system permease protein